MKDLLKIVNKVEKELNTFTQWGFSTMPTPEGNGFLVGAQLQSKAGDMLVKGVEPYFHKYVFHAASGAKFAMASLGNDAGAYGAFKLALDAFK